ncbi:hypothetical protein BH23PLA1_BH23PLA1_02660 [soil metagenome]
MLQHLKPSRLERYRTEILRWLGERPEYQISAFGLSLALHGAFLLIITLLGILVGSRVMEPIQAAFIDTELPDLERLDTNVLTDIDREVTVEPVLGSFSPRISPQIIPDAAEPPEMEIEPIALTSRVVLPTATTLSARVMIKGDGAEQVDGVEAAVDRLALEILRKLEKGRTLVIWVFDASGSLYYERERLAEHIDKVYDNVLKRDEARQAGNDGLLTGVVAFGQGRQLMTPEPTHDPSEILEAIHAVPLDESGEESTFQTVIDIVRRWGKFQKDKQAYQTMVIIVTDEVGDDQEKLEVAIASAREADTPIYVLGSPAPFGRKQGFMDYTDPKTGRFWPRLPLDQGPESVAQEMIRLPFWYDGPQYNDLDSGFGSHALSRLAGSTGGIYFVTRMGENRPRFDPAGMREYRPDWVSQAQYRASLERHPLRQAVLLAAQITQQNLPGQPSLRFPAAGTAEFKREMERNQEIAARVIYTVDEALEPILAASQYRDRETSRRWQAHYDLIKARLLAVKIRCFEYNWACAQMKVDPKKFQDEKSNAWQLRPDDEVHYSARAAAAAEEATELLQRVISDHRGTPWALLAQRELKDPLGFKWVETYVPPPQRNSGGNNAARKNQNKNESRPPTPPKL